MYRLAQILTLCFATLAVAFSLPATAGDFSLKDALKDKTVSRTCGDPDRIRGTLRFANDQAEAADQCSMYRFVSRSERQCSCLQALLTAVGEDAESFYLDRGMSDAAVSCDAAMTEPANQPEVCADGCNCSRPINAASYR